MLIESLSKVFKSQMRETFNQLIVRSLCYETQPPKSNMRLYGSGQLEYENLCRRLESEKAGVDDR